MRAVLFDAAGTLIVPREGVGRTYVRLARDFGIHASPARLQQAFTATFRRMPPMAFPDEPAGAVAARERGWWRELVTATFRAAGHRPDEFSDFDGYFDRLFKHFAAPDSWQTTAGAVDLLATVRERGLRTGVVSNFDQRLRVILQGLRLAPLFDAVVLPADAGAAKPDARIFHLALERLGVPPQAAAYVGDDIEADVRGAQAAGLHGIHAQPGAGLHRVLADVAGLVCCVARRQEEG